MLETHCRKYPSYLQCRHSVFSLMINMPLNTHCVRFAERYCIKLFKQSATDNERGATPLCAATSRLCSIFFMNSQGIKSPIARILRIDVSMQCKGDLSLQKTLNRHCTSPSTFAREHVAVSVLVEFNSKNWCNNCNFYTCNIS